MKTTLVRVGAVLLFVALAAAWTGCASSSSSTPKKPKLDPRTTEWNNYIGNYAYEQALQDLGKPAIVGETSDGRTAEWVIRRSSRVSFGFGVGGGSYGPHSGVGVGVGSSVFPPPHGENLRLNFGADGILKQWTKVTY